jgi:DNA (cytosine-5)-methyltransferase 1
MLGFYEFFAGGGMARAGLGDSWSCLFANDFNPKKASSYEANWGKNGELLVDDIRNIKASSLRGRADLAWGSFPCQDLSLAGSGAGLQGKRSGTFYPFWDIMNELINESRAPKLIVLENVCGTLTSHEGKDFRAICNMYTKSGYLFGALIINASLFVPQSRPRLFMIGVHKTISIKESLLHSGPLEPFHPRGLCNALNTLPDTCLKNLIWWNIPKPPRSNAVFADIIEENPLDVDWHTPQETRRLLELMSPIHMAKVKAAQQAKRRMVGGVYKRTRHENGIRMQRAEVRFDDVAGCLRTPGGGSSRQIILVIEGEKIRSRLISSRETARLMGLPENYTLPSSYNEAYHLTGDGVVVPVVRHLTEHIFEPLLGRSRFLQECAA